MDNFVCELCKRPGIAKVTEHHLIPREKGGKFGDTVWLCEDCHRQIHALYSNKELAMRLNTLAKLEEDEKILKYLKYVRKQPPTKKVAIKKSREVRKKSK